MAAALRRPENDRVSRVGMGTQTFDARQSRSIDALRKDFEYIERIDRLITVAENRRNDALNEIERRRALWRNTATKGARDRGRRV